MVIIDRRPRAVGIDVGAWNDGPCPSPSFHLYQCVAPRPVWWWGHRAPVTTPAAQWRTGERARSGGAVLSDCNALIRCTRQALERVVVVQIRVRGSIGGSVVVRARDDAPRRRPGELFDQRLRVTRNRADGVVGSHTDGHAHRGTFATHRIQLA